MVRVLVPAESREGERRVAATPETVRRLVAKNSEVFIESGAGLEAGFSDEAFIEAGASIVSRGCPDTWSAAELVICVQPPVQDSDGGSGGLERLASGSLLVGLLDPYLNRALIERLSSRVRSRLIEG